MKEFRASVDGRPPKYLEYRNRLDLALCYRGFALDLHRKEVPKLLKHVGAKSGYLKAADVLPVLGMMERHCQISSSIGTMLVKENLGLPPSDVGLEFLAESSDLSGAMESLDNARIVDAFEYIETIGWLVVKSVFMAYGEAGLLVYAFPNGLPNPGAVRGTSNSAVGGFLEGLECGRMTKMDAERLIRSIEGASLLASGLHLRTTQMLLANPGWRPVSH